MGRLALQVLVLVAIAAGLAFGANRLRSGRIDFQTDPVRYRYQDVHFMSVADAATRREDPTTLFLDARDTTAYERRHVFGAVHFPADHIDAAYMELRDFLAPDLTLVVYSRDLLVSVRAARFLTERGYNAFVLDGGWDAWRDARHPVE